VLLLLVVVVVMMIHILQQQMLELVEHFFAITFQELWWYTKLTIYLAPVIEIHNKARAKRRASTNHLVSQPQSLSNTHAIRMQHTWRATWGNLVVAMQDARASMEARFHCPNDHS
jgi:hypothetical protein